MKRLIFGCGYLGLRAARRWRAQGDEVLAVTRSPERAAEFAAEGFAPLRADVTRPESLVDLPAADTVLYAVGFDRSRYASMRAVYVDGLRRTLDALPTETGRIVYISSTSVYGPAGGDWVDEDAPCLPDREAGRVCLEAEETLLAHPLAPRAVILRLAGIYGPGRLPLAEKLRRGEPLPAAADGWLNLIHVDDAASAVLAAAAAPSPPQRVLVADGCPVVRRDFYTELARLLAAPPPRFTPPESGPAGAARGTSDKRIRNERMRVSLGVLPRYGDYRAGLAAIVEGNGA